jgi:hypothetical protein
MKEEPLESSELFWRRKLTDAERAELRGQPEISAELELESRLTETLAKMPDAAVPSNFINLVLQAVELGESRHSRKWNFNWDWHALLPRIAVSAAVVLFAGLAFHRYELTTQRTALARNVALIAGSQPLPSVDALKNFDAIQRMSQPRADEELLALMQ